MYQCKCLEYKNKLVENKFLTVLCIELVVKMLDHVNTTYCGCDNFELGISEKVLSDIC